MQSQKRIFDDLAKVAGGALGALGNLKQEIEVFVRQRVDDFLLNCDFVKRDEFEVVKAMAAELRIERDGMLARLEALEKGHAKPMTKKNQKTTATKTRKSKTATES